DFSQLPEDVSLRYAWLEQRIEPRSSFLQVHADWRTVKGSPLSTMLPKIIHPLAEIEIPSRQGNAPIQLRCRLTERTTDGQFIGGVRLPEEYGEGMIKLRITIPALTALPEITRETSIHAWPMSDGPRIRQVYFDELRRVHQRKALAAMNSKI